MNYFSEADSVNLAFVVDRYKAMVSDLEQKNIILQIQVEQHKQKEQDLLNLIKEQAPAIFNALNIQKGEKS